MEPTATLSWGAALQGVVSVAILLVALSYVLSRIRDLTAYYWILAWAALLGGGALLIVAAGIFPPARYAAYVGEAWMAPLLYMGALQLSNRAPRHHWPLLVGLAAGLLRAGMDYAGLQALDPVHSATIAPAFLLATAVAIQRAPEPVAFRAPIVALVVGYLGVELADAWLDWRAGYNTAPWRLQITIAIPLFAVQMASRLLTLGEERAEAHRAQHEATRARDLERDRVELVFSQVQELLAEIDEDTRILFVNARAKDVLGLDPETLIGRHGLDFIPEEQREDTLAEFRRLLYRDELGEPYLVPVPRPDGVTVFLEVTISPYEYVGKARLLVVARDVTSRVETERALALERNTLVQRVEEQTHELRASLDRLREQERLAAVGTLASGIAHQINNPVGAISAAAEFALLAGDDPDAEKIREASLNRIVEESARAGRIVKSILRFARHGTTNKWVDDLAAVVRRSVELVRPYVVERGGRLDFESSDAHLPVAMSPIEVEQMMVNLIRNAAESLHGDGRVLVRAGVAGDDAIVEVIDQGRGMDADTRARVFDPFFTTRLRDGGSGLGLSVVHGIVSEHGGEIEIESEPDRGTRVRIRFPRSPLEDPAPSDAAVDHV